jgi:hypothetical protein
MFKPNSKTNVLALPAVRDPAAYIQRVMNPFDYNNEHLLQQMRNFLIFKMIELAESDDPAVSLKGMELLGRTNFVSLFKDKVEVSFSTKTTEELEQELRGIVAKMAIDSTDESDENS